MSLLVDIEKDFGSFSLKVKFDTGNDVLALLGASGCGKSMTLKCIAGIETPDRGRIVLDGVTLFDSEKKINLPPQKRHTGLMFQNYALFPNMTVLQNILAGAHHEQSKQQRLSDAMEMMARFDLTSLKNRYPHQLSGGQQQRVALARMLMSKPNILLLDEPFSALDTHLRFQTERQVRQVIQHFGKTVLLVSHDRDEVFRMADRIAIMGHGTVEVIGNKHQVFQNPETKNAAILTGCKNISDIRPIDASTVQALDWGIRVKLHGEAQDIQAIGIRMRAVRLGPGENSFHCQVIEVIEDPFTYTVMLRPIDAAPGIPIGWVVSKPEWETIQSPQLQIHLPPESILLLKSKM